MTEPRPTVIVSAALIAHEGRILAAKRAARPGSEEFEGKWELPGGKVEPGEQPDAACRRECKEELGITLGVLWPYTTVEHDYPEFHLTMEVFSGTLAPGQEPKLLEHEAMRWLSRDELLSVDWLPADVELVRSFGMNWDGIFEDMHM